MILVRNVFQLKFGKAREAVALWKEGAEIGRKEGMRDIRLLTDLVGPYYTLVMETSHESLAEYEEASRNVMDAGEWKKWYEKFLPLVEGGHREIWRVVE